MGQISIAKVVQLLNAGGVRAEAAYPAEMINRVIVPVAAVSLAQACPGKESYTMLVEILGPKESGGLACQQKALEACAILKNAGAVCTQGSCSFLSKGNVFRVPVEAEFSTVETFTIATGELKLAYACGFSAEQKVDSVYLSLQDAPWEFTIEEFFPWGVQETLYVTGPFQLNVCCGDNIERYEECTWTERKRVSEKNGIRQIRTGKAVSRILTSK